LIVWSYIRPVLNRTTERLRSPSVHTAPTRGATLLLLVGNSRDVATGASATPSGAPYRS
jgi:hypothetical protein